MMKNTISLRGRIFVLLLNFSYNHDDFELDTFKEFLILANETANILRENIQYSLQPNQQKPRVIDHAADERRYIVIYQI